MKGEKVMKGLFFALGVLLTFFVEKAPEPQEESKVPTAFKALVKGIRYMRSVLR